MIVVVTGSRDLTDQRFVFDALDRFHATHGPITLLVEGGQRKRDPDTKEEIGGLDYLAHLWAVCRGVETVSEAAEWTAKGRAAGPIRNAYMLDKWRPKACLRFPGGVGTNDCATKAKERGIPVYRVS